MHGSDWKTTFSMAANVAVITASTAVVLAVWVDLRATRRAAPVADPQTVSLRKGGKAPSVAGVDYARSERTLLLFLSVHCRYCQESVPFYRDLAASLATAPVKAGKRRVLAVFPEDAADVGRFEDRENFNVEAVVGFQLQAFGVNATPTAVRLCREGQVLQVWQGAPKKEVQDAIRSALLSI